MLALSVCTAPNCPSALHQTVCDEFISVTRPSCLIQVLFINVRCIKFRRMNHIFPPVFQPCTSPSWCKPRMTANGMCASNLCLLFALMPCLLQSIFSRMVGQTGNSSARYLKTIASGAKHEQIKRSASKHLDTDNPTYDGQGLATARSAADTVSLASFPDMSLELQACAGTRKNTGSVLYDALLPDRCGLFTARPAFSTQNTCTCQGAHSLPTLLTLDLHAPSKGYGKGWSVPLSQCNLTYTHQHTHTPPTIHPCHTGCQLLPCAQPAQAQPHCGRQ